MHDATPQRHGHASGRQLKRLRRACHQLLEDLALPADFTIPLLAQRLSASRGRPIVLAPMELREGSLYGVWIATDVADFIAYESRTSLPHQHHIIAHELAHIVCGHHSPEARRQELGLHHLFPSLDPAMVRQQLGRSAYGDQEEQEAETMASLLLMAASRRFFEPLWQAPSDAAGTLSRIEHSLGRPGSGPV